jgi:hypothetical protein
MSCYGFEVYYINMINWISRTCSTVLIWCLEERRDASTLGFNPNPKGLPTVDSKILVTAQVNTDDV